MRLSPSPAAQFQATKTRAKLGIQLYSQTLLSLLIVWILLMTWVVWHDVGIYLPQLDHVYFGRWIWCSVLTQTPWLKEFDDWLRVPFAGTYYPLPTAAAWIDGPAVYRASFYHAFGYAIWHGWGLIIDLIPLALVALLVAWRWRQDPTNGEHIRGLQLVTRQELQRQLRIISKDYGDNSQKIRV